jgi:hypothetical protein
MTPQNADWGASCCVDSKGGTRRFEERQMARSQVVGNVGTFFAAYR